MRRIVNPYTKYNYSNMVKELNALRKKYECIIDVQLVGHSRQGRELMLVKLGHGEKKIFMVGAHHAREYISSAYLMCVIECYASLYCAEDEAAKNMLEKCTLYILPMMNPDGVNLAITERPTSDIKRMRMVHTGYDKWKANAAGVDLNRQYPALWQEKYSAINAPASEQFKGYNPASEPEVKAVMKLCKQENFDLATTFHAKGEEIYWADENSSHVIPIARPMALKLAEHTGYELMPISTNPSVYAAGFENWFRQEFSRACFLFEMTPFIGGYVPHNMRKFDEYVWCKLHDLPLVLSELL